MALLVPGLGHNLLTYGLGGGDEPALERRSSFTAKVDPRSRSFTSSCPRGMSFTSGACE